MNPLIEWHQILTGELVRTRGMFLKRFKHFRLSGLAYIGETLAKLGLINCLKAVDIGKKGKLFNLYVRYLVVV